MKFRLIFLIFFLISLTASPVLAFQVKDEFPKLANYYLQPIVPNSDYSRLAKFDLVVLDADVENSSPGLISEIKKTNPKANLLAYVPSQSVNIRDLADWSQFRQAVFNEADAHNRWLRDDHGNYVYFSNTWPFLRFIDTGNGWSNFLSDLTSKNVNGNSGWDGVFYDMVFANLGWLNGGNIDLNKDGAIDDINKVNNYWQNNANDLINQTKQKTNKIVVVNADMPDKFKNVGDGVMLENFPAKWLGPNSWSKLETTYLNSNSNDQPKINIINANLDNNVNSPDVYKKMRFGLASTLMGDGYFSFDYGDQNHSQTWWYDEYDVSLGKAETKAYNLLAKANLQPEAGLWRRDFERGVVLVNSTDHQQNYIFKKEEFEKIKGTEDKKINNGTKINWISLAPADGVVLLKTNVKIENSAFNNGAFVRVFNDQGQQTQNGFFAYEAGFAGNTQLMFSDINQDKNLETLVNGNGQISIYNQGKRLNNFKPYGENYNKIVSFAAADLNRDGKMELITGTGNGGGPQVRMFSYNGKLLNGGFFAYDSKFRGGVNVAAADLDGNGTTEIITGPGPGTAPQVKIFSTQGKLLKPGFFVYDKNYRGGVSVAVGDVNGDGQKEIITGAVSSGGPQVKIFNKDFKLLGQFFAYDPSLKTGIRVIVDDINKDKVDEILASTNSFDN